jgi:hypothetical protein
VPKVSCDGKRNATKKFGAIQHDSMFNNKSRHSLSQDVKAIHNVNRMDKRV